MFVKLSRVAVLCTTLLAAACGSKGAVSLVASLEQPTLTARSAALGTELSGGFELVLSLGKEAPSGSSVELGNFVIKGPSGALVDALSLAADADFPVSVAPGESQRVHLALDGGGLVAEEVKDALCAAELWYAGDVLDAANGGKPTPVSSAHFQPTCE